MHPASATLATFDSIAAFLAGNEPAPLAPSYQRLQELMLARATGHHSHTMSETQVQFFVWTGAIFAIVLLAVGIWAQRGANRIARQQKLRDASRPAKRPKRCRKRQARPRARQP